VQNELPAAAAEMASRAPSFSLSFLAKNASLPPYGKKMIKETLYR